jgi:hypothetical protein
VDAQDEPSASVGTARDEATPTKAPPGWYGVGAEPGAMRWWDGFRWTDFTVAPAPQSNVNTTERSRVRAIATTIFAVLGGLSALVLSMGVYSFASGIAHDAFSLDDEAIRGVASTSCSTLTSVLERRSADRVADIRDGNAAIQVHVDAMETLDHDTLANDKPALDWINDWKRLASSRAAFAEALRGGSTAASFDVPTTDGYPITERMADVAPEECARAIELAAIP